MKLESALYDGKQGKQASKQGGGGSVLSLPQPLELCLKIRVLLKHLLGAACACRVCAQLPVKNACGHSRARWCREAHVCFFFFFFKDGLRGTAPVHA